MTDGGIVRRLRFAPESEEERHDLQEIRRLIASHRRTVPSGLRPGYIRASSPPSKGRLLFRVARLVRPGRVVEFGTAFGNSACYLARGLGRAEGTGSVVSVEFNQQRVEQARRLLALVCPGTVDVQAARFDEVLDLLDGADLFYLDGQHTGDATREFVHQATQRMSGRAVMILDDVDESRTEMDEAWRDLSSSPDFALAGRYDGVGLLARDAVVLQAPVPSASGASMAVQRLRDQVARAATYARHPAAAFDLARR